MFFEVGLEMSLSGGRGCFEALRWEGLASNLDVSEARAAVNLRVFCGS